MSGFNAGTARCGLRNEICLSFSGKHAPTASWNAFPKNGMKVILKRIRSKCLEDTRMTVEFRKARAADAPFCASIICAWGAETPWMVPIDDTETVAASWRDLLETDTAWVAEISGHVVGFCVREDHNITGLYVRSDARSLGVGKGLLDLAKVGRDWITVWVYELNELARAFYRREGLRDIGREKDEHSHLIYREMRWKRA